MFKWVIMDEEIEKKLFGKRIRELRKNLHLTQFELGEKANIDQRQIAYIECGHSMPSVKTMIKLAEVFDCQLKDLFDYIHLKKIEINIKEDIQKKLFRLDEKKMILFNKILDIIEKYPL
ncbi:helix-turn-helix transcriptional regulator [bacterium]|nr:helix-turn-helix transcriptional regulator [bacterium]